MTKTEKLWDGAIECELPNDFEDVLRHVPDNQEMRVNGDVSMTLIVELMELGKASLADGEAVDYYMKNLMQENDAQSPERIIGLKQTKNGHGEKVETVVVRFREKDGDEKYVLHYFGLLRWKVYETDCLISLYHTLGKTQPKIDEPLDSIQIFDRIIKTFCVKDPKIFGF
eukprot:Trichotokara_eunicae@DN1572_c0_g1_i3.p1